jgi:hypothetical protein
MIRRALAVLACGLAAGALSEAHAALRSPGISDFADLWHGLVAWRAGANPYLAVNALHPDVGLLYPLPALILLWPLGYLPLHHAEAVFVGIGAAALVAAGWGRPLAVALVSASAFNTIVQGQWSLLLTASALVPALGVAWAAKPSIGLALALAYPRRRAFVGAGLLGLLSFAIWPGWVPAWLAGLGRTVHISPMLRPGGAVLLLALLRWRRPEGRLLAALALIPQTGWLYDTVPLFLIPRTRYAAYGLAALTQLAAVIAATRITPGMDLVTSLERRWPVVLLLVYLPALILVLRPVQGEPRQHSSPRPADDGPLEAELRAPH